MPMRGHVGRRRMVSRANRRSSMFNDLCRIYH